MFEQRYTGGTHLEKIPDWHIEESPWKAQNIAKLLTRNTLSPQTICEVGCGFGEVLKLVQAERGAECECLGYEISPVAFAHAQERTNEYVHFKLGDFLAATERVFDLLLILDVVEHVENYLGFLQDLKPKGEYKIFQVPLELSVQTVFRRHALIKQRDTHGHLHYFTHETFLRSLEDCGYQIVDYIHTSSSLDLPTHVLSTKLMRVPRKVCYWLHKELTVRTLGGFRLMVLAR